MFNPHRHIDTALQPASTGPESHLNPSRPLIIPFRLGRLIADGALSKSAIQVLFAWLELDSTQSGGGATVRGAFPTTQIASRCRLTIKATQRAKAGLVALGVVHEQQRSGNPSILTLDLDIAYAAPDLPESK